jgi:hypothetical protein
MQNCSKELLGNTSKPNIYWLRQMRYIQNIDFELSFDFWLALRWNCNSDEISERILRWVDASVQFVHDPLEQRPIDRFSYGVPGSLAFRLLHRTVNHLFVQDTRLVQDSYFDRLYINCEHFRHILNGFLIENLFIKLSFFQNVHTLQVLAAS